MSLVLWLVVSFAVDVYVLQLLTTGGVNTDENHAFMIMSDDGTVVSHSNAGEIGNCLKMTFRGDDIIMRLGGAAFFAPTDTFSFEELYKRADRCTYESKEKPYSAVTFHQRRDM